MTAPRDEDTLRRLLDIGRALVSEGDPDCALARILDEARAITGARYVVLGVLDERRARLERFLTCGVENGAQHVIGDVRRTGGGLRMVSEDPRPLRVADVDRHRDRCAFPAGLPVMNSFLGVPIVIRGRPWGNLSMSEKEGGGGFTEADEEAATILAGWAAAVIENARLHEAGERRRQEAEQAVLGLRAAREIADDIGRIGEMDRVLEQIVRRARALVDAHAVMIMLCEGDELVVSASAGLSDAVGHRLPISASTSGRVLERGRSERIDDIAAEPRIAKDRIGVPDARSALLVPMLHGGAGVGVLSAFDRGADAGAFSAGDEELLRTFASWAATAVAIHRGVQSERLRTAISAADAERRRWARELHDETLQALGGLRVLLASAQRRNEAIANEPAIRQAIEDIELETDNLRAIINDLRPALLDDLGLVPALEALIERRRATGLDVVSEIGLDDTDALDPALTTTVYRVVQEALTNVARHARARFTRVAARMSNGGILIEVEDDGVGFDTGALRSGFGLAGMRERTCLAAGTLDVESGAGGTSLRAWLPVPERAASRSDADHAAASRSDADRAAARRSDADHAAAPHG